MDKAKFLRKKADEIREEVIDISLKNGAGHIAPSLSCVDILVALYYGSMNYHPEDPLWDGRDRLIFSKAHGCYSTYAILADKGIMPDGEWKSFYTEKSTLPGCMERKPEYGLEAGCGSLGHGLPIAVGVAFGAMLQAKKYHTFCVVGDGEMQEGSAWEALQFAVKHEVSNLTIIVDRNRLQAMNFVIDVLDRGEKDLIRRFRGFGISATVCPGHDAAGLANCINGCRSSERDVPNVIIADTVKGYSLKCMENMPKFHFRIPTQKELGMGRP